MQDSVLVSLTTVRAKLAVIVSYKLPQLPTIGVRRRGPQSRSLAPRQGLRDPKVHSPMHSSRQLPDIHAQHHHYSHHSLLRSSPRSPCTVLSGILIFNQKGENLIFRAFRNDCRPRLADVFRIQVISNASVRSPILTLGSTTFSHVKHENIYLVAITKSNANAALVFEFLYRFVALGKGYFGKFDEEAVKSNFVLVYELLDGTFVLLSPEKAHGTPVLLPFNNFTKSED